MYAVGIDLAAEPSKTALAGIEWSATAASVRQLDVGVGDDTLLEALSAADKAGIDCPLGWPTAFAAFVAQHHDGTIADAALTRTRRGDVGCFGAAPTRTYASAPG